GPVVGERALGPEQGAAPPVVDRRRPQDGGGGAVDDLGGHVGRPSDAHVGAGHIPAEVVAAGPPAAGVDGPVGRHGGPRLQAAAVRVDVADHAAPGVDAAVAAEQDLAALGGAHRPAVRGPCAALVHRPDLQALAVRVEVADVHGVAVAEAHVLAG